MKRSIYRKYINVRGLGKPKKLTEIRYDEIIDNVLANDQECRQELILGFIMLVITIAGSWSSKFPSKQNDILGVAFLTLMESVERTITTQTKRDYNAFSAYIHARVRGAIINMIRTDYVVKPPANSTWFIKEVALRGSDVFVPFSGISNDALIEGKDEAGFLGSNDKNFDFSEVELLNSPWFSKDEKIALQMRLNGKKHEDIARALALSRSRVTQIFNKMHDRVVKIVNGTL